MTRHIPEDELHAYLDQALSRSQCIEIERHVAECEACQSARDAVAALRDRTTALLSRVGPQLVMAPPFETLERRGTAFAASRARRRRTSLWAASVAGALATGFVSHHFLVDARQDVASAPSSPTADRAQASPDGARSATAAAAPGSPPIAERGAPPIRTIAQAGSSQAARARAAALLRHPAPQNRTLGAAGAVNEGVEPPALDVAAGPPSFGGDSEPSATVPQPAAVFMSVQRLEAGQVVHTVAADLPSFQPASAPRAFEIPAFSRREGGDDSVRALLRRLNLPNKKP